ncbi:hypothetical protein QTQ03_20040 [Micromonospora sp. WMMA1363]|uniref:hypothetical protein n=1 Tax=Micromonospora sp. WMMA1363 TaxID=3053985 RepID=UPI00259CAF2B|nr:hypothetical protein [Micromonospora sp. WMMA1363]MDM4721772.1 hypothetical protein [Micromonospora sp. WMMA1363]
MVVLAVVSAAGCGTPPELRGPTPTPAARTATPGAAGTPTAVPSPPVSRLPGPPDPGPTSPAGQVAVACPAGPTGQRVTALVRNRDVLPPDARVRVRSGPLCAADWHYTVLDVTGYEPLQVVSRGSAAAPRLVTAGTDVCTAEVRVAAPLGIRTLACGADAGA